MKGLRYKFNLRKRELRRGDVMTSNGTILWIDEEENAAYPEMIQLRFYGYEIDFMPDVVEALNTVTSAAFDPSKYGAFVIDAHMPNYGDARFERQSILDRSLAGVRLCDILVNDFTDLWDTLRNRTLIYTMLPQSPRVDIVRLFAASNNIAFVHKSDDGQIYDHLRKMGWLS
jgi:hypothetical protein